MRILRADVLGMCFGVRDALALAEALPNAGAVTIHGELVHNVQVIDRLHQLGFVQRSEADRRTLPETEAVLVTAHGISQRERERLQAAGKRIVDSTCPLVTRAHDAAQKLQGDGYHVLVVGRPGHVEVQGIVEDLESYTLIPSVDAVVEFPHLRLGIMCQTTTPSDLAASVVAAVRGKNPQAEVRFVDTVCHPTKEHLASLERLLDEADAVVVVGGKNSNNTRQLAIRCRERGVPAHHVEDAHELRPEWFAGCVCVGLTAGTSTLAETIDAVERRLRALAQSPSPYPG